MKTIRDYINLVEDNEYFEPPVVNKQVKKIDVRTMKQNQSNREQRDAPDLGAYMFATQKTNDPHTIRLQSHVPEKLSTDAKYAYIMAIKNLIGENPYVPAIDEIKLIKSKNVRGKHIISYEIRKLFSGMAIPPLQLYFACKKIFNSCLPSAKPRDYIFNSLLDIKKSKNEIYQDLQNNEGTFEVDDFVINCMHLACDLLEELCNGSRTTNDLALSEIVNAIKQAKNSNPEFYMDIHRGNVMFRMGPHGAQLVITDPIASP